MSATTPLCPFIYQSPVGALRISGDESGISEIVFCEHSLENMENDVPQALQACVYQLDEYFAGSRKSFALSLKLKGTAFQQRIWSLLQEIPYGKTISYLDLALKAGNRKLIRAVGLANGANKLAIVVPCHRVIGSNGKLVGYAGGLWRKKWLLNFERKEAQPLLFQQEQYAER